MPRMTKDLAAGSVFTASGLLFGYLSVTRLSIGSALNMGPGYFPLVISILLIGLGLIVVVRGLSKEDERADFTVPWRGVLMISLALLTFALTLYPLGLFLAVTLTAFVACLSRPGISLLKAILIGFVIAAFCTVLFVVLLGLPIPYLGTLFS